MPEDQPQKQLNWFACDVTADAAAAEAVEHALNELGALGTEINHLRLASTDPVTVTGYFNELPDESTLREELVRALKIYDLGEEMIMRIVHREVEDQDWLSEWKKHWRPTEIGNIVVAPPWSEVDEADKIVIRIEPNMAFGTGTHETTQLCLRAIGANFKPGQSLLDVGTGTGILAIAAAKLSTNGSRILACDTDHDSVSIARENAVLNHVDESIEFYVGSIHKLTPTFDFVCANLTIDVIVPLLDLLLEKSSQLLLLSGILTEQERQIVNELDRRGTSKFDIDRAGEWISVLIRR